MSQDDDRFHSHRESVTGDPTVIIGRGLAEQGVVERGIHFRAIQVWEDIPRVKNPNGMFIYTLDGISVAHMGDIGHPLNDAECAALSGVDVLLAITGGGHTIAIPALVEAIKRIRPKIVIPMHFQTGKVLLSIFDNTEFFSYFSPDDIVNVDAPSLEISAAELPAPTRIMVLRFAR